jgi:hypothetical protein
VDNGTPVEEHDHEGGAFSSQVPEESYGYQCVICGIVHSNMAASMGLWFYTSDLNLSSAPHSCEALSGPVLPLRFIDKAGTNTSFSSCSAMTLVCVCVHVSEQQRDRQTDTKTNNVRSI